MNTAGAGLPLAASWFGVNSARLPKVSLMALLTHKLPFESKVIPSGQSRLSVVLGGVVVTVVELIVISGVGAPLPLISVALNLKRVLPAQFETHRLPCRSKASASGWFKAADSLMK